MTEQQSVNFTKQCSCDETDQIGKKRLSMKVVTLPGREQ